MKLLVSILGLVAVLATETTAEKETDSNIRYLKKSTTSTNTKKALCVVGCTPYVNPDDPTSGILKWDALVAEMAQNCAVVVHVGDTKASAAPCNKNLMTGPLKTMATAARKYGSIALYAVGDNEMVDCHRDGSKVPPRVTDFYKASNARAFIVSDMNMNSGFDLSGKVKVQSHVLAGTIPGTTAPYSCDFDKYVEVDNYAVVTLEVPGSFWYLADQSAKTYINQDSVDPLAGRLSMYLNAKDCALDWITQSALKASTKGLKAVYFTLQAHFWGYDGEGAVIGPYLGGVNGVGTYYNSTNLASITEKLTGKGISEPYQPLYDHLTRVALQYPKIMFYVVNADNHLWTQVRMNSVINNSGNTTLSHHNLMILQVEGDSRALTMYAKFSVDGSKFQPVNVDQMWSKSAYDQSPVGHNYYKYA